MSPRTILRVLASTVLVACSSASRELARKHMPADVVDTLGEIRRAHHLPALVVGVVPLDGQWSLDVQGERLAGSGEAVVASDLFHMGSAAKPLTADLIAMLVAEGHARWEATVGELVPELLPPGGGAFAAATLRQVLGHEAGLPKFDELSDAEWDRLRHLPGSPTQQRAAVLREILAEPLAGPRGERAYSNAGYLLAGYIAERLSGQPFEALRRGRLLVPLGMEACREGWPARLPSDRAPWGHYPHSDSGGAAQPAKIQPAAGAFVAPSGDLSCPPEAIARYLRWHLGGIAGRPTLLWFPEVAVLHGTPPIGATPLGWGRSVRDDGTEFQSILGSLELFSALLTLDVTHRVGYFALTNVGESSDIKTSLVAALRAVQRPVAPTSAPEPVTPGRRRTMGQLSSYRARANLRATKPRPRTPMKLP